MWRGLSKLVVSESQIKPLDPTLGQKKMGCSKRGQGAGVYAGAEMREGSPSGEQNADFSSRLPLEWTRGGGGQGLPFSLCFSIPHPIHPCVIMSVS